jgi:cell division protein FtsB
VKLLRSNLAYDYRKHQIQEEQYEEQYEEIKEVEIEPKKRSINGYVMAIVLGAMILIPGALHVNCIYSKMKSSMKIGALEKRKVELNAEISKLKADYDSKIDLKKVEEIAITKLGFVHAKEIKYIKITN